MHAPATSSSLMVLGFTDIVGSTQLKSRLGDSAAGALISRHDQIVREIVGAIAGAELLKDTGDGFLVRFATPSDAVQFALQLQAALNGEPWGAHPIRVRIGLHLGEVSQLELEPGGRPKLSGLTVDLTSRIMSLALPGQILMTRALFDSARQNIRAMPPAAPNEGSIRWVAHGAYVFKGWEEPLEVFEVGAEGLSPLREPPDSEKARRCLRPGEEQTLGWRPAAGLEFPSRPNWVLSQQLGEGGFGEVWLAEHRKTHQKRVFKFCFDAERLKALKREVVLFRLMRDALGDRPDINAVLDYQFESPPFFIELPYLPAGNLAQWAKSRGGIGKVPLATRLKLAAEVADALAAAHSVGVLHKDIKPTNVLIREESGAPHACLTDFGIGMIADRTQLEKRQITMTGLTESVVSDESTRAGTRMYLPPETLAGKPFTVQGDVYAMGVLLYQLAVGGLDRPIAGGWEREIADELLREDIAACVDGDPKRRPTSASEIVSRLRKLEDRRRERREKAAAEQAAQRRRKLVRIGVGAIAALAVLSIVLIFGFLREWQQRRRAERAESEALAANRAALAARERAQRRYEQVRQFANTLMLNYHEQLDQLAPTPAAKDALLASSLAFLDSLLEDAGDDPKAQVELMQAYMEIGKILAKDATTNRSHADAAIQTYERARRIGQNLAEADPVNAPVRHALANCRSLMGMTCSATGKVDEALAHMQAADDLIAALCKAEPANLEYRAEQALYRARRAAPLLKKGAAEKATAELAEALKTAEKIESQARKESTTPPQQRDLAICQMVVGQVHAARAESIHIEADRKSEWRKARDSFQSANRIMSDLRKKDLLVAGDIRYLKDLSEWIARCDKEIGGFRLPLRRPD